MTEASEGEHKVSQNVQNQEHQGNETLVRVLLEEEMRRRFRVWKDNNISLTDARRYLYIAQAISTGRSVDLTNPRDNEIYSNIQERIRRGESFDQIIRESASQVRGLYWADLQRELAYHQAVIEWLGDVTPAEEDIITMIGRMQKKHAIRLDDPALAYITAQLTQGRNYEQIRQEAEERINDRKRTYLAYEIIQAIIDHRVSSLELDIDGIQIKNYLEQRINNGEHPDKILTEIKFRVQCYEIIEYKRELLKYTTGRIREIERKFEEAGANQ